jgi:hypothetical protein
MNLHAISSIARSRRDDLLREAAEIRSTHGARRTHSLRRMAARAAHATGRACFVLADAIAGEHGSGARERVL